MNENDENEKPVMSQKEASWHELRAGQRAAAQAQAQGEDPKLVEAVVNATVSRPAICHYEIKPATKGTIMAISRLALHLQAFADERGWKPSDNPNLPSELDLYEMAFMIMIFDDAKRIYSATAEALPDELIEEADSMIFDMSVHEVRRLQDMLEVELTAIGMVAPSEEEAATPGKQSAPSPSSEEKTPLPGAPSPSPIGSCQNTASPSTTPSGNSPSSPLTPSCPPATSDTAETAAPTTSKQPASPPGTDAAASLVKPSPSGLGNTHGGYPGTL